MGHGREEKTTRHLLECVKERILETVQGSQVPEDAEHAENTLKWVRILRPNPGPLLEIGALGHDIERAVSEKKVRKEDFSDYNAFKSAHAANSARILAELMEECGWDPRSIQVVSRIVSRHEIGGDEDSNLLRDADALSFFEVNLPYYFKRHDLQEVERRCIWGYLRLSPGLRHLVKGIRYDDKTLQGLVARVVKEHS
jgi:hypothetical protein